MPDKATLRANAQEKLDDARALYTAGRYDGTVYVCGYAVEFALKARICDLLDVDPYPDYLSNYKTHVLETLLILSGRKKFIVGNRNYSSLWAVVINKWRPEMRYDAAGMISSADALALIEAVTALLPII